MRDDDARPGIDYTFALFLYILQVNLYYFSSSIIIIITIFVFIGVRVCIYQFVRKLGNEFNIHVCILLHR